MVTRITKLSLFMLLAMALLLTPLVSATGEAAQITKPKTSAPPDIMQPMGLYTGYTYLWYSTIMLTDNNNGTISIGPTTLSKSTIDEVGAIVQLQRWTGSAWVDSGTETTLKALNTDFYGGSTSKAATTGYYYRAKVIHYCKHGSVYESATEYTGSILKS